MDILLLKIGFTAMVLGLLPLFGAAATAPRLGSTLTEGLIHKACLIALLVAGLVAGLSLIVAILILLWST